ncbi:hypothetical protein GCM10011517_09110 [Actibacterium pelagium]|uniref:Uncharacterized protein n=1 Tax=Actibacterium pelagium TaxID=2029103 RepID=A0A917EHC0_9RHOB|nr:hypothetical protein GCM10011517_09110 [Actibacterium pelagium]
MAACFQPVEGRMDVSSTEDLSLLSSSSKNAAACLTAAITPSPDIPLATAIVKSSMYREASKSSIWTISESF